MTKSRTDELWTLVSSYLEAEHLELDDLELIGRGRGTTLRVLVDSPDGVDLDRLAEVSRNLSRVLDAKSDLDGPYNLEVSSPGLERKLRRPSHFEKAVGGKVKVKARVGDRNETITGNLIGAGPTGIEIETDDARVPLDYSAILKAKTIFRWEKSPKPGKAR